MFANKIGVAPLISERGTRLHKWIVVCRNEDAVMNQAHVGRVVQANIFLDPKRGQVLAREQRLLVKSAHRGDLVKALRE